MIKIYTKNEIKDVEKYIVDSWDFPIEELDYLLEEHNEESFVLINNRLYEIELENACSGNIDCNEFDLIFKGVN